MKQFVLCTTLLVAVFFTTGCRPVAAPAPVPVAAIAHTDSDEVTEQVVAFENDGETVVGTLAFPTAGCAPCSAVLLLHGFTNERNELPVGGTSETMYGRLARVLGEQGIASLRIDFRGSGDSDGAWADTTFTGQLDDAQAAVNFLATRSAVDMDRLGVLGFSQGGLIAAELAAQDARVRTLVLWSPVASAPDTYKHILGAESVEAGLIAEAPLPVTTQWGAQFELNRGFFIDLLRYDPIAAIAKVEAPLLVIVGLNDTTVTPQPAYGDLYLAYHDGNERLVALESDHVFNVLTDQEPAVFDTAVAASVAWLVDTLPVPRP